MRTARTVIAGAMIGAVALAGAAAPAAAKPSPKPTPGVSAVKASPAAKSAGVTKAAANLANLLDKSAVRYDRWAATLTTRATTDTANAAALNAAAGKMTEYAASARTLSAVAKGATTMAALKAVHKSKVALHKKVSRELSALGEAKAAKVETKEAALPAPTN
jgi:hypothetical protein